MRTARSTAPRGNAPGGRWTVDRLRRGDAVELTLAGVRVNGTVASVGVEDIAVDAPEQPGLAALQMSVAYGTAAFPVNEGAIVVPVSVRAQGLTLRVQLKGPASLLQRRAERRTRRELPVSLAWLGVPAGTWERTSSTTLDLSRGGMRVAAASAVWPRPGTTVVVTVDLPEPIRLQAEVLGTTDTYDLRLKLLGQDEGTARQLDDLIAGG